MTSAERQTDADELIVQSEALRAQLRASIERLDAFVEALQDEVARRRQRRTDRAGSGEPQVAHPERRQPPA